ncbi:hypothetical protein C2E23DRAFT_861275 [Lenzites betulinus]|nr:hypothetical protein C2E23DRAFT_861275 [Lenzites betulinus]
MPNTQEDDFNTIRVRVRGSAPTYNPRSFAWRHAIWCDVAIMPALPIKVGQKVRLMEVMGLGESPGEEEEDGELLEDRDIEVEGIVTSIRTVEKHVIELVIENEAENSSTELAYLSVEYIPGKTIALEGIRWIACELLRILNKPTRRAPVLDVIEVEEDPTNI